jgi:hypothetical protein
MSGDGFQRSLAALYKSALGRARTSVKDGMQTSGAGDGSQRPKGPERWWRWEQQ